MNRAIAHLRCTGHCEADLPCDCELANDTSLDATRPFPAPPAYDEPPRGRTLGITVLALALIAAGLVMPLAPRAAFGETALVLVGLP